MAGESGSGWSHIADETDAPKVLAAIVSLEPGEVYTRSELADAADVSLKTLYLIDTLDWLDRIDVIDRLDTESDTSETKYVVNSESEVFQAARDFDSAVRENLPSSA